MLKRIINRILIITGIMILVCSLPACGKKTQETTGEETKEMIEKRYTPNQMYILLASEKNNIISVYTEEVFKLADTKNGSSYMDSYIIMMKDYLSKVYTMLDMADQEKIELTADEKRTVRSQAEKYMADLGKMRDDEPFTQEDVVVVLSNQKIIDKLSEYITENTELEISESDARVMNVQMMVLNTQEDADEALREVNKGKDFLMVARGCSVNPELELKVGRGDFPEEVENVIFDMEDGAISEIIKSGERFYLFKCISGYDQEATAVRKDKIYKERKNGEVGRKYYEFIKGYKIEIEKKDFDEAVRLFIERTDIPNIYEYME